MKFLKHLWRLLVLWILLGMGYTTLELLFRGVTYVQMLWIGGLVGVLVGLLNEHPAYYNRLMWQQCLLGTIITDVIEFISGYVLNIVLHRNIWDYSSMPYNFHGQICLFMTIAWFFLMPFAIYADDWLRYKLFDEEKPEGNVLYNYKRLFTGK
ncbi:putative membrane protein [[Clostridium] cellulosi]|uniref:Putative membrane protein n=1 Tax=[Clostridium] cellulosi TaxID=29343 RepID=A0A078KN46_9FIRM|nr:putative membrane protein [[Clostridium] cellulosi]